MQAAPDGQVSLTDPDARSMATSGRGTGVVGYNVQTAVDTKHHLIVAHEVTNLGHDRTQLSPMAQRAREGLGKSSSPACRPGLLQQRADPGLRAKRHRSLGTQDADLRQQRRRTVRQADFIYNAKDDEYQCPAGQRAIRRFTTFEHGLTLHKYWSSACPQCKMKAQCTTGKNRRITRWEHEEMLERCRGDLNAPPRHQSFAGRPSSTFGTLKAWMGATHFLTKTLPRVRTEMSLHVLAYNLKRMMRILGVKPLIRAMAG